MTLPKLVYATREGWIEEEGTTDSRESRGHDGFEVEAMRDGLKSERVVARREEGVKETRDRLGKKR